MWQAKCPIAGIVCPRNNDPRQGSWCPAWWEFPAMQDGQLTTIKECGFQAQRRYLEVTVAAAEQASADVTKNRNDMLKGIVNLGNAVLAVNQNGQAALGHFSGVHGKGGRLPGSADLRRSDEDTE